MNDFDAIVATWEEQLRSGRAESLRQFWGTIRCGLTREQQQQLLFELAALELEYVGKTSRDAQSISRCVADHARHFPNLYDAKLQRRIAVEAFRVRWRFADRPRQESFLAELGQASVELQRDLQLVELELKEEFGPDLLRPTVEIQQPPTFDARAPLSSADYLVQRFIGAGSLGRVYRARQHSLQRTVALKFLRKHFLRNEQAVDRFLQEARLAGGLRHPGIIGIHGLGRTPAGSYFIAMDFIDGQPLAPIDSNDQKQLRDILDAVAQAAEAMSAAHAAGVIHCDLKPANILRAKDGRVTLTDFGLARQLMDEPTSAARGEGTPVCIAPEQIGDCWGDIGPATDVFNLAATLYLLLTGQSPHAGNSTAEIFSSAVSGQAVPPLVLSADIPAELIQLCAAGLRKNISERLTCMSRFASALQEIASNVRD
jgi:tRNA A-37 threonylcarbamoyl transferase component Bud32